VIAFLLFAFGLVYVLVGYPLLLRFMRGRRPDPCIAILNRWPSVSVILPVRDGERWIENKLRSLRKLDYDQSSLQIIVILDGSTDGTGRIASGFGVDVIPIPPGGKAAALNAGLDRATGEILFFTDVRQPLEPGSLKNLVSCLSDPATGVATGELIIRSGSTSEEQNIGLYWHMEKWIRKRHSEIDSVLGATGAIYAMKRHLAVRLPAGALLDDVYLPMAAHMKGYRIRFVEDALAYDEPTMLNQEFQRKVRTQAGVFQLLWLMPGILGRRNRMWFHFYSHKLGRLLLPYCLIGMFISSFWLPAGARWGAFAGQLLFYGIAALDPWVPESPVKKLSSIARTFVILMWAAFCAGAIFFRPNRSFWTPSR
jgi:cellulose synthase/poly-beta-1,6-N-acetylglucosamine synthase-like glycosyltransferase